MKADVEKLIKPRVAAAFSDILPSTGGEEILGSAEDLVRAVWMKKIYDALPKDRTKIPEYFLDAELQQFLNEAIEECHARICRLADEAKGEL
jgi:hypothetical protein